MSLHLWKIDKRSEFWKVPILSKKCHFMLEKVYEKLKWHEKSVAWKSCGGAAGGGGAGGGAFLILILFVTSSQRSAWWWIKFI